MKRLTVKKDGKYTVKTASSIPLIINRLAEYENTEEQIANKFAGCIDMKTILDSFCAFYDMQETNEQLAQCTLLTNEDVLKYQQWKDAEEQGLLLRLPAPLDDVESFEIADKGICLKIPCQIGDTVYVICECETIPPQLDGTLYGENGEPGTATGYYCPYEENCPHVGKACEDDFDCDKFKGKPAVFEDSVIAVWHDESGVSIITSNCPINSRLGEYIFFTKEEAEQALARMEKENGKVN